MTTPPLEFPLSQDAPRTMVLHHRAAATRRKAKIASLQPPNKPPLSASIPFYLAHILHPKINTVFFTGAIHLFYEHSDEMYLGGWSNKGRQQKTQVKTFRPRRPLLVKAEQCTHPSVILTDCGERKVLPGDWIIQGL